MNPLLKVVCSDVDLLTDMPNQLWLVWMVNECLRLEIGYDINTIRRLYSISFVFTTSGMRKRLKRSCTQVPGPRIHLLGTADT